MLRTALALVGSCWICGLCAGEAALPPTSTPTDTPIVGQGEVLQAYALRMNGDLEGARRALDVALSAGAPTGAAWFESARLHFCNCAFDQAARAIRKAIAQDENNPRYHFWAGQIATYNAVWKSHDLFGGFAVWGQMAEARREYERTVQLREDYHQARLDLINLYLHGPGINLSKAQRHLEVLSPQDAVFAARAACLFPANRAPARQLEIWRPVARDHPDRADACFGLAEALYRSGQYGESIEQYTKALALEATKTEILFGLARCYQATKDLDRQAECYQRCLQLDPPAPIPVRIRAMRFLASTEMSRGHAERAATLRAEADRLDPRLGKRGAVAGDVPDLFTQP